MIEQSQFPGDIAIEYLGTRPPVEGIRKTAALIRRFRESAG
jgi:hypothetical protein